MGLAQTMLTIAAMALLATITLTLNSSYLTTNQNMIDSEFTIEAISVAESYLERAVGKNFDEKSIASEITKTKDFSTIGKDSGEDDLEDFDDFDDFHGYTIEDTTARAIYDVYISVVYVDEVNPNVASGSKTWHKKITVTVSEATASYMKQAPVQMSYIFSYF